jgi:hypothetical protein
VSRELRPSTAPRGAGGHLTILRFRRGWKIGHGTPDLFGGRGYGQVLHQPSHPKVEEALRALVARRRRMDEPDFCVSDGPQER